MIVVLYNMEIDSELFECNVCVLKFTRKYHLERHIATKKHKDKTENTSTKTFSCSFCTNSFSHQSSRSKHQTLCKLKNTVPLSEYEMLRKEKEAMMKEKEAMQKQIEELLLVQNNNQITNNNNNIGTQVNITINAFGKENIDYINDKQCLKIVNQVFNSIPAAAHIVFFNPEHPENHNIKIPNKKEPYAMIMKADQTWEMTDRKKAIETMTQKSFSIAEESYGKVYDKILPNKRESFEKFMDKMNDQDSTLWIRFKKELEMKVIGATRRGTSLSPLNPQLEGSNFLESNP